MAKVSFNKMALKVNTETCNFAFKDMEIEVKQYLPVNEKLELISSVINNSTDDMNFYNVGKLEIFLTLEIMYHYTNINFTDTQKKDVCKLYDTIVSSGLYQEVIERLPKGEYDYLKNTLMDTVQSIYTYHNSIMGILERVSADYSNLSLEASEIQKNLADPDNMTLLKDVLTKLG